VWAYDFVFDTCANGQTLKCLTLIDEFTRECLAIDVAGSIRSARVIEVLARLVSERGAPQHLRSDNGTEFVSKAILEWLSASNIGTAFNDPGKPWQNGRRELQRQVPGRVLEPGMVSQPSEGTGGDRTMAAPLQQREAALESALLDAR
jgi:transposase InsO family protein